MLCLSGFELYFRWVPLKLQALSLPIAFVANSIVLNYRQLVIPLFIRFVFSVIVVFCRCRCSLCLSVDSVTFAAVDVACTGFQVDVLASEEFLWKIFPGEDFQPLSESSVVMLAFVCHLHKKIARDSLPAIA